jgi:hypothetical protein
MTLALKGIPLRKTVSLIVALSAPLFSTPVANDDAFEVNEDQTLIVSSGGTVLSANFEAGSSLLGPSWTYLDSIQNENGSNQSYPVDGSGRAWNSPDFDSSTSTVGTWTIGNAPFQAGTIDGFPPGTVSVLGGLDGAQNGENLVTTYLFRQQFTLTAAQAVETAWELRYLIDDGAIVYLNGTEVYRTATMPAGPVNTNTLSQEADETNFINTPLNLSGVLQEGVNTIAVEVHQSTRTSSDVGLSLSLTPVSSSALAGFTYVDDTFNDTSRPNNAFGELDATGGFTGGALFVQVGRRLTNNRATSGGWQRTFTLDSPAVTTVSFRYRLTFADGYEDDEFGEALFEVDGVRYGNDIENSLTRFRGDGNSGGGEDDTGWLEARFDIPLDAGDHTMVLGAFSSKSTANDEFARTWFDDVVVTVPETGGGVLLNDDGDEPEAVLQEAPQNGSLNLNADGSFTYQPNLNFFGTDTFRYLARDPSGGSEVATVTLTVNPVNDPPVATAESYQGIEGSSLTISAPGVLENDRDLEEDALSAVLVADAINGTLTLNPDGSFLYNPNPGFFGIDAFSYRASDGPAISEPVLVTLEIAPVNDPPVAVDDSYLTLENIPLDIVATRSGDQVVFESNFDSPLLDAEISGAGVVESVQGYEGRGNGDRVFSGQFLRNQAAGNPSSPITLTLENLPPHQSLRLDFLFAVIDSWDGNERFTVTVDGVEVFGNTFRNNGNGGSFDYPAGTLIFRDQDVGFTETNAFRDAAYDLGRFPSLRDIPHTASTATISWFVTGDGWQGGADESWAIDNLRVTVTAAADEVLIPAGATWSFLDDGSDLGDSWRALEFNDLGWANGPAQLGYGDGDEATTVSFGPENNQKYITTYFRHRFMVEEADGFDSLFVGYLRDDGCAIYLNGTRIVLDNLDPDAPATAPALSNPGRTGEDTWSEVEVPVSLLQEGENVLAVEVHQDSPNSSDISMDAYLVGKRSLVAGVMANDTDPENDRLVAELLTPPQNGTIQFNPEGTFRYTPGVNYEGTDSFTYRVSDGEFFSPAATVALEMLAGPNDFPETTGDSYDVVEDIPLNVATGFGVLRNDSDPEGSPLNVIVESEPSNGTLALNPDGSFTYVPSLNFFGTDTFTYRANDGTDTSRPEVVTLTVAARNDPPVGFPESYLTAPGTPLEVVAANGVLANDADPDNSSLEAVIETPTTSGSLNLAADGSLTYSPGFGFSGTDTFTYRVTDGLLESDPVEVAIVVNAPPTAVNDTYQMVEDTPMIRLAGEGVLDNDLDADSLTAVLVSEPLKGTLVLGVDGGFIYIPDQDFNGSDSFTYRANDSRQDSNPATVTIVVEAVDDAPRTSDDEYETQVDELLVIGAGEGVLGNDFDVEGSPLTATLLRNASSGTLSFGFDGSFRYQPAPGFSGTDSFSYLASDGNVVSGEVEVEIKVAPLAENIVINEIMFNPTSGNELEEFIELTNIGNEAVSLAGWQFDRGVALTFPEVTIPPGGYLVVSADPVTFEAAYGVPPGVSEGWTGRLSNSGERIRLVDQNGEEVDEVRYYDQGDWAIRSRVVVGNEPGWEWNSPADGQGSSLELLNPAMSNKQGQNWTFSATNQPSPGAANASAVDDIAPFISEVEHRPAVPTSSDPISIVAELRDESGETVSGILHYRVSGQNPGPFLSLPMFDDGASSDEDPGDGIYGAMLPPQPDGTIIEFYIESSDGTQTRTWPKPADNGQTANALLQVDDEANTFDHAFYRIIMPVPELSQWSSIRRQSNAMMNVTVILDDGSGPDIRYLAGMRVRGAGSRNHTPVPMRVSLPRDNDWNNMTRMNLNTRFTYLQFLGMKLFQASGIEAPDTYRVQVRINGEGITRGDQFDYGSVVHVQPLSGEFIEDKFPNDDDGNLYKKVRPDREFRWRDGNINGYESDGWSKQTNGSRNDWSDLDELLRVVNNTSDDPEYLELMAEVANLDQWMDWFALNALLANGETNISNGADDDFSMYRGANDPRFVFLPHDLDTILSIGDGSRREDPEHTIFDMIESRDVLDPLIPLFTNPVIVERYYRSLRKFLQTTFSKAEFDEMLDNTLGGWVPQDRIEQMRNFMDARREYIEREITPVIGPPTEIDAATSNAIVEAPHGSLFLSEVLAVNDTALNLNGTSPDVIELHNTGGLAVDLGGMSLSDDPANPTRFVFPANTVIAGGGYLLVYGGEPTAAPGLFTGFNLNAGGESLLLYDTPANGGALIDSISFGLQIPDYSVSRIGGAWQLSNPTLGGPNESAALGNPSGVRVNEWLSQDVSVFDDEFVELFNPSDRPVALGGLAITDEPVSFPNKHLLPDLSFIAPNGFAVLTPEGDSADPARADELPFRLASENEWIALRGTNEVMIDQVHFVNQRADRSRGRSPDGSSTYEEFVVPTPGYTNGALLANEALLIGNLRITEIMYDPLGGSDFEFIELQNIGLEPLSLDGVRFTEGIRFVFPALTLPPGEFVILAENREAFESRYGEDLPLIGQYDGKLDNGGERIRLEITSVNAGIHDFEYDDWFPASDGSGFSLEINEVTLPVDAWNLEESWGPGLVINGTPGSSGTFFVNTPSTATLTLPDRLVIEPFVSFGSVSPASVNFQWALIEGPANVFFSNPGDSSTAVEFAEPGDYRLRLTATAFDIDQSQEVEVTVYDSYSAWVDRVLGGPAFGLTSEDDDFDGDGVSNLFEFALGMNPTVADAGLFPIPTLAPFSQSLSLSWTTTRLDPSEFAVVAEVSSDLKTWQSGPLVVEVEELPSPGLTRSFRATDRLGAGDTQARFMRLRVVRFDELNPNIGPEILSFFEFEDQPAVTFTSQPGQRYQLEVASDSRTGWLPLGEPVLAVSQITSLLDSSSAVLPTRIYRVRRLDE